MSHDNNIMTNPEATHYTPKHTQNLL